MTTDELERLRLATEDAAGGPPSVEQVEALIDLVDALESRLAALTTPQEDEWEYGTALRTPKGEIWDHEPDGSLAEATDHLRLCMESPGDYAPDECIVIRRVPGREAGPWLPVGGDD